MSYQKAALRLALAVSLFASASAFVLAQDSQDPSTKARNVKPELKKAYKDWLDKDVTYIITDEERKLSRNSLPTTSVNVHRRVLAETRSGSGH
jgi:hypothetical protein